MAIRKPGSRFTDRNTMRTMHAEGYSIAQIGMKLSIVNSHVKYCIEEWGIDQEKGRDQFKLAEKARLKKEREAMMLPAEVSRANLRAELRAELQAEMKAATVVASTVEVVPDIIPGPAVDDTPDSAPDDPDPADVEFETPPVAEVPKAEAPAKAQPKRKRKRRAAA